MTQRCLPQSQSCDRGKTVHTSVCVSPIGWKKITIKKIRSNNSESQLKEILTRAVR